MKRTFRTFLPGVASALFALAALVPVAAQAQNGTLVGKVSDAATGAPLSGATVIIGGTTLIGVTNESGEYSIVNIRPGLAAVSVQRIGYQATGDTVRIGAGARVTKDFTMSATVSRLSEVVVTGVTGNTQRKAQAAVVASVPAAELVRNAPISNVNELLQSRLPGVSVNAASGSVGTSRSIRIRGASSINLSNQPLIFIDGIRISEGQNSLNVGGQVSDRLNDINPDDIESIEVVKGPAAATLYGADASAGVIQIITKKGKLGANSFEQNIRFDVAQIDQQWTPPDNFANCRASDVASTSLNPLCRGQAVGTLVRDNPLVREDAFRQGSEMNLGWTGRGGGNNYGYFLSATGDKAIGTLDVNRFERYGFRSNVNFVPNSQFKVDIGLNLLQSNTRLPDNDNNGFGWLGGGLLGSPLTRRDDGSGADGWFGNNRGPQEITAIVNGLQSRRTQAIVTGSYQPTDWFTNRLTVGADLSRDEFTNFYPRNNINAYGALLSVGDNTQGRFGFDRYTIDYLGTTKGTFGADDQWGVNFSGGLQSIITRSDFTEVNGNGFISNAANSVLNAALRTGTQNFSETKAIGWLGELQISNQDKRFLQLGARVDKNSAFGTNAPSFFLPRIGASWVLSEESFFEPLDGIFSQFRVRAAYGTTGRAPGPTASLTTFAGAPTAITGVANPGVILGNPGNDSLKAERGTEFEAGLDAAMFNDRVSIELTYFDKRTKDLLLAVPQAPSLGFTSNPFANIGAVSNKGLELVLTANLIRRDNLDWTSTLGGNTLQNRLEDLGPVNAFNTLNRFTEGYQLGAFVTKPIRSIDEATGRVVVADTFEVVGNILPTREWNWSNTIIIAKNFRVQTLLDAKGGHHIFNNTAFFRETQVVSSDNRLDPNKLPRRERLRRYGNDTPGQPAFVMESGGTSNVNDAREAYIEKADFIRLREVAIGYTLPRSLLGKLGNRISGATFTLAAQNLALWTDYSGPDPEVISAAGAQFDRTDFLTLPNPRRFVLKTNFTF
jgi:TonB-linked SusC/RagA family outer membrane protein